ncbi:MAG: diphosphate--fructose-6-phosphate 1-phosphotransferase, partial [Clostridia bacterium]|nr:diphosphate--fructose-6-phosphate 1-phosphotransferase [Clostridia bacterium]
MNIAVAQSGGPTCAINASLLGVLKKALGYKEIQIVYGAINGIEGIINDHLVDLEKTFQTNENMELLRQTPSTVLGSCRYKLPDCKDNEAVYKKIIDCFNRYDIKAFFYIGGNDSMDTVAKLSAYFKVNNIDIKVLGIPKTIDNDLCETDHTPGFGSAAKYVATSIQEITRDSLVYNLPSVTIIEIMGRHAGWLTASSCLLHANGETAPHLIYLPECEFSADKFLNDIKEKLKEHKSVIIAVSEGIKLEAADSMRCDTVDSFGHKYLNGVGKYLEGLVKKEIGCKVRSIELNV